MAGITAEPASDRSGALIQASGGGTGGALIQTSGPAAEGGIEVEAG